MSYLTFLLYVSYNIGIERIELHTNINLLNICRVVRTMNYHKSYANFRSNSFKHIHCILQHIFTHFKFLYYTFHIISQFNAYNYVPVSISWRYVMLCTQYIITDHTQTLDQTLSNTYTIFDIHIHIFQIKYY